MRLRQVALVAQHLAPVRAHLFELLGLRDDFRDPAVAEFGLENSVMALGDTFLEVVAPVQPDTTAGRFLRRRGGDGGYMVLVQCEDIAEAGRRVDALGVRRVWEVALEDARAFHMHPRDVPGAIVSLDQMQPPSSWRWGGEGWEGRGAAHVRGITAVELQAQDVEATATRWARVFGRNYTAVGNGLSLQLDEGEIRFVEAFDGRGDGISAVDLAATDVDGILAAAARLELPVEGSGVRVCGTWLRLVA
ncbi:MAG: VOC family protein [Halioglobus sp.]|nr:VOC family protein [Halioglobus sp.]